jgi:hypothetical protein
LTEVKRIAMSPQKKPPMVALLVPSGRSWEADMAMSFTALTQYASGHGIGTVLVNEKNSLVFAARNSMVKRALELNATHVFFVDSDMVLPHDVIPRLLAHDKDIVGATYTKRVPPYNLLGVPGGPVDYAEGGLIEHALMPGGCMLIKTDVFKTVPWPWYFDTIRRPGEPLESFLTAMGDMFFTRLPDALKQRWEADADLISWLAHEAEFRDTRFPDPLVGEDYNFCLKAMRYGFQVWCDLDVTYKTGHIGEQTVFCAMPGSEEEKTAIN